MGRVSLCEGKMGLCYGSLVVIISCYNSHVSRITTVVVGKTEGVSLLINVIRKDSAFSS